MQHEHQNNTEDNNFGREKNDSVNSNVNNVTIPQITINFSRVRTRRISITLRTTGTMVMMMLKEAPIMMTALPKQLKSGNSYNCSDGSGSSNSTSHNNSAGSSNASIRSSGNSNCNSDKNGW